MEWQPIETAPRDGTRILLGLWQVIEKGQPPVFWQSVGFWDDEFRAEDWDYEASCTIYRKAWTDLTVGSFSYEEYAELHPTHWQPLPPPPE